jgi:aryl-alcohol dehydrogenase-like predicted oxidoreductase
MNYPFVLGTAQLGSHYGITNSSGCPSDQNVTDLLDFSLKKGITLLDTAFAYGDSLERIERYYSQQKSFQLNLINKFSVVDDFEKIYEDLLKILKKTGLEKFYGILIHDPLNLSLSNEKHLLSFLKTLKEERIVDKVGVSIYAPRDLDNILDVYPIDLIQCPLNLFDQRLLELEILDDLRHRKIEVHARSLFLQGVLLSDQLPQTLGALKPIWNEYRNAMGKIGLSPLSFILSWLKSLKGIDKWVIGVNGHKELAEILSKYDETSAISNYDWTVFNVSHNPAVDPRTWNIK